MNVYRAAPPGGVGVGALARPPQQRARPRDQLADAKGLGQVVVGAALEADDPCPTSSRRAVSIRIGRRDSSGRSARRGTTQPVEAGGTHQVEDQQVETAVTRRARAPSPRRRRASHSDSPQSEMQTDELECAVRLRPASARRLGSWFFTVASNGRQRRQSITIEEIAT